MKYVDIQKKWPSVKKYYQSKQAEEIWKPEMQDYAMGRASNYGYNYKYEDRGLPADFDSCDWRWCREGRNRGPHPRFWDYVCHSACHWTCNLHLHVALLAEPKTPWRIVSSHKHSTVWDGNGRLWDGNFLALGVCPIEAFDLAHNQPDSLMLPVGQPLKHPQYRLKRYRIAA